MPVSRKPERTLRVLGIAAVAALPTAGRCAVSPSVGVLGAYFPDWLFCIIAGVLLTVVVYLVLARMPDVRWVGPGAVVYPTLVALFALVVWLIFFYL